MNLTEPTRAYIYRILIAVGALAVVYGLASGEELALWLGVAAAALNILPTANTSTKAPTTAEVEADAQAAGNDRTADPYAP